MGRMLIVDGIRFREEDAKVRGLIGERKIPDGPRALSAEAVDGEKEAPAQTPVRARNKSRKPASK